MLTLTLCITYFNNLAHHECFLSFSKPTGIGCVIPYIPRRVKRQFMLWPFTYFLPFCFLILVCSYIAGQSELFYIHAFSPYFHNTFYGTRYLIVEMRAHTYFCEVSKTQFCQLMISRKYTILEKDLLFSAYPIKCLMRKDI